jgi:hypothetical protein
VTNADIRAALQKALDAAAAQMCAERGEWQAVANWTLSARQYLQHVTSESANRIRRARMRRERS